MLEYHYDSITCTQKKGFDNLIAYCTEVAVQIALCENNEQAKDLYLAIYSAPETLHYAKDWTAEKNIELLGGSLPAWDYEKFRTLKNICCCIERSALTEPCTEKYDLEEKIALTLSSLMKLYNIPKPERERAIKEILSLDYISLGKKFYTGLTRYVNVKYKKMLDDAVFVISQPRINFSEIWEATRFCSPLLWGG